MRSPRQRGFGAAGAAAACLALLGCGPPEHSAEDLHEALLAEFEDAVRADDQTQSGVYSELDRVQGADALRDAVESDKPECLDTGREWGRFDEVRSADAALGIYGGQGELITHLLLDASSETVEKTLSSQISEDCASYAVTNADGSVDEYTVTDLDVELGEADSYAYLIEVVGEESEGLAIYNMVYEGDGYLGVTTVMGSEASEETLVEFAGAAREHEQAVLS